ncbi:unnamed protein product [Mytilus edulis]|nr:unnamed protein product [Mytilus edulis]
MKYWKGQKPNNSFAEIPLLDNQNMPLVALFDTTKLNEVLRAAIKKTVEDTMNEMIPRIKQAVIDDIGYEPGREQGKASFLQHRLHHIRILLDMKLLYLTKIWLNMGGAYDNDTGVFTAPKTGLYSISTTVMSYTSSHLHCDLWKNNEKLVRAFGTKYSTGTLNVVVALKKSDTVYVKHISGGSENILEIKVDIFWIPYYRVNQ